MGSRSTRTATFAKRVLFDPKLKTDELSLFAPCAERSASTIRSSLRAPRRRSASDPILKCQPERKTDAAFRNALALIVTNCNRYKA